MSQDTAFEKFAKEKDLAIEQWEDWILAKEAWQAATAEANKRIAELQASNNDLKDALYVAFAYCPDNQSFDYIETLLATTPAESLAQHDDELIEKAYRAVENISDSSRTSIEILEAIRALKEVK